MAGFSGDPTVAGWCDRSTYSKLPSLKEGPRVGPEVQDLLSQQIPPIADVQAAPPESGKLIPQSGPKAPGPGPTLRIESRCRRSVVMRVKPAPVERCKPAVEGRISPPHDV